jgi:hypothetical protein
MMYSDESTFKCIRSTRATIRRPQGSSRYDCGYTVKTVKHPDSVMLRGFSGTLGCTGLYFLTKNTTINSTRYQEVMEDHLLMFMGIHGCTHFFQDGVPFHASKRIKDFLAEQPTKVIGWSVLARQPSRAADSLLRSSRGGGMGTPPVYWQAGGRGLYIASYTQTLGSWDDFL